tara:strand:+ start:923 stop:1156 length:234 start_codon:yes stop_codon:yes gene_type:complete
MDQEKGFYKLTVTTKGSSMFFSTHLENRHWTLDISLKDTYTYPIDDWYYFDTLNEACASFEVNSEDFRENIFPDQSF